MEYEDGSGHRAIHYAAAHANPSLTKLLIKAGANVNAKDKLERTPLHCAITASSLGVIKTLLSAGCNINVQDEEGDTLLHSAITRQQDRVLSLLLDHSADPTLTNKLGYNALHYATANAFTSAVEILLRKITLPNFVEITNPINCTALSLAAAFGHFPVLKILVILGKANIDFQGPKQMCALHYAAEKGHLQMAEFLVQKGANLNLPDYTGSTPLHLAMVG